MNFSMQKFSRDNAYLGKSQLCAQKDYLNKKKKIPFNPPWKEFLFIQESSAFTLRAPHGGGTVVWQTPLFWEDSPILIIYDLIWVNREFLWFHNTNISLSKLPLESKAL